MSSRSMGVISGFDLANVLTHNRTNEDSDYSHFLLAALLMSVAAFFASASLAKPMTGGPYVPRCFEHLVKRLNILQGDVLA